LHVDNHEELEMVSLGSGVERDGMWLTALLLSSLSHSKVSARAVPAARAAEKKVAMALNFILMLLEGGIENSECEKAREDGMWDGALSLSQRRPGWWSLYTSPLAMAVEAQIVVVVPTAGSPISQLCRLVLGPHGLLVVWAIWSPLSHCYSASIPDCGAKTAERLRVKSWLRSGGDGECGAGYT
jgi:hypothetical protein